MKKKIYFQKRVNKNQPTKYYPRPVYDKTIAPYGVIDSADPFSFEGWDRCQDEDERFEIKQFIQMLDGINQHINQPDYKTLEDVRIQLPESFIAAMRAINQLAEKNGMDFNYGQTIVAAPVNLARSVISNLPGKDRDQAIRALKEAGVDPVGRNKNFYRDHSEAIEAIFTVLYEQYNGIEALSSAASQLFNKQKDYSKEMLYKFSTGDAQPNRWMITSTISAIANSDGSESLQGIIKDAEQFIELWAKPLVHNAKMSVMNVLNVFDETFEFTEGYAQNIIKAIKKI
jgi:hypothetical protein